MKSKNLRRALYRASAWARLFTGGARGASNTAGSLGTCRGRWLTGLRSPAPQVVCVESDAKKIGGHKSKLSCAHPDHANDYAIGAGHDPAVPQSFSEQDCRNNRQTAGEIIKP